MESIKNRNESYKRIVDELPDRQRYIYNALKFNPNLTATDITDLTGIPLNQVTGRITELKDAFVIIESGSKLNKNTGKQNTCYKTVDDIDERIVLINKSYSELTEAKTKLETDCKLGLSNLTKNIVLKEIKRIKSQINLLTKILSHGQTNFAD